MVSSRQIHPGIGIKIQSAYNSVMCMHNDDNLILHNLHFMTAHFSFITAHLCSDNSIILGTGSECH